MGSEFTIEPAIKNIIIEQSKSISGPFYLYDVARIRETSQRFKKLPYQQTAIHFASMANASPSFLQIIHDEGLNIFVNSIPHLKTAALAGFQGEQIIFTASAMSTEVMRVVKENGVLVNLDSLGQIEIFRRLFKGAPFGIRCNIGSLVEARSTRGGYFIGKESRLGLSIDEIQSIYGDKDIIGLHVYVGTDIYDISYFKECYTALASLAPHFPSLEYLDFGGGFGCNPESREPFNYLEYGTTLELIMNSANRALNRTLRCILEPGRIIGAQSGYFICSVVDVKRDGVKQLIGVNASSAQFPRPLLYPETAAHPVNLLTQRPENVSQKIPSSIYGCSTYSRDFLANNIMLPQVKTGDMIAFADAGAYCASLYTKFLGFDEAPEIFHGN